jgi:hypothetical protein
MNELKNLLFETMDKGYKVASRAEQGQGPCQPQPEKVGKKCDHVVNRK